jgi:hypothetical protein
MMNGHHQAYIQAAIEGEISGLSSAMTGERNDKLFKAATWDSRRRDTSLFKAHCRKTRSSPE